MRSFTIRLGVFLLGFILINIVYIALLALTDCSFKKRIESLSFENPDYKLLVLGNSLALDGIDTEYITSKQIKSYNLALGGSSLKTNFIQLNEYIEKCSAYPNFIVVGLGSYMGEVDGESIHPVVEFTMGGYHYSIKDIPVIKFQWLAAEFAKKIISKVHRKARISYGQLKFQKKMEDNTNYQNDILDFSFYKDSKYLGEIASICWYNNIEMIVLEMPGYQNTRNSDYLGPFDINFKNGCSAKLYNFNSIDFCKIFSSKEDWVGNSHLNEFGARKFTEALIHEILP